MGGEGGGKNSLSEEKKLSICTSKFSSPLVRVNVLIPNLMISYFIFTKMKFQDGDTGQRDW